MRHRPGFPPWFPFRPDRKINYTPIGYPSVIVGQKRRNAPRMTHNHAWLRIQALFRTRTGEMSAALLASARTRPLLTHNPWPDLRGIAVYEPGRGDDPAGALTAMWWPGL